MEKSDFLGGFLHCALYYRNLYLPSRQHVFFCLFFGGGFLVFTAGELWQIRNDLLNFGEIFHISTFSLFFILGAYSKDLISPVCKTKKEKKGSGSMESPLMFQTADSDPNIDIRREG